MAAIRGSDTKPELLIRQLLHRRGFRYRLHDRKLPGKPDLVFPKFRAVLFVNGCFWHGHDCPQFHWPKSREDFWREKICGNVRRDLRNEALLSNSGWRFGLIWECAIKGPGRLPVGEVIDSTAAFLEGSGMDFSIQGQPVDRFTEQTAGHDAGSGGRALLRQTACSE
jgi:DNA mismatch endonuclease (patch repair protein)